MFLQKLLFSTWTRFAVILITSLIIYLVTEWLTLKYSLLIIKSRWVVSHTSLKRKVIILSSRDILNIHLLLEVTFSTAFKVLNCMPIEKYLEICFLGKFKLEQTFKCSLSTNDHSVLNYSRILPPPKRCSKNKYIICSFLNG